MPDQTITLTMVLAAQDKASEAIKKIGGELAKVGKGLDVGDLSGSVRSSLSAVNAQLQQAADERLRLARETAAREVDAARSERLTKLRDIRDDYEQQRAALGKATLAQRQALRAAREAEQDIVKADYAKRVDIAKSGLAKETSTISAALQEQLRQQRAAGDAMIRAAKNTAAEQAKVTSGASEGGRGSLERFADFGKQLIVWNLGYQAVSKVMQAFGDMAGGLISVNANLEQYQATFNSIYQSSAKGQQAVAWLTDFAVKVPATRTQTIQAGLAVASLGDDVTQVLPALSNISAVMGVDLPRAAQAFADAQMGRFQMLQTTLHITKQELVAYGLQLDSSGHVLNNSFVPAFEKLGNVRFAAAAKEQMGTFGGLISNVADAFTKLQEVMGKPIFNLIKGQLQGLIDFMGRTDTQRWALGIGDAIAHMLQGAMNAAAWFVSTFGPGISTAVLLVRAAWADAAPFISAAIAAIGAAAQQMGAFLQSTVLPAVQSALGTLSRWWHDHAAAVEAVLGVIIGAARISWGDLGSDMKEAFTVLKGVFQIGWGLLSGVTGAALDVMHGDWRQFGNDLDTMATTIAVGVVNVFKGMTDKVIDIISGLKDAINSIEHALYGATAPFADELFGLFTIFQVTVLNMYNTVMGVLDKIPGMSKVLHKVSLPTATQIRADQTKWEQTLSLGFRPGVDLTFGQTATQAKQHADDWYDTWIKEIQNKPNLFTGTPKGYDTSVADKTAGTTIWDTWMKQLAGLRKAGLHLPSLPGGGGSPGAPDLTLPGYSTTTAGQQKKSLDQATKEAQDRFQLLLDSGKATWSAGIKDINAILSAEKKAGASPVQMQLDALRDTKDLVNNLLDTARKHFDFDTNVAHPSRAQMQKDEAAVLAILAKTPGIQPIDLKLAKQQMDKTIADSLKKTGATAAGGVSVPTPLYGPYRITAPQYGATQVSFGGAQQSSLMAMVQKLEAMVSYWRSRAHADEASLRAQEATAGNTKTIAQRVTAWGTPVQGVGGPAPPPTPAGASVRARGGFGAVWRG